MNSLGMAAPTRSVIAACGKLTRGDSCRRFRDAIERASGKPPRGWMAPWMASTHHTPDLLKEVGFDFLMDWPADDQPLWMKTRSGPLMSVPYPIEVNDSPQILVRH